MSTLKIKNNIGSELKLVHKDNQPSKTIDTTDISYTRATVDELRDLVATDGEVCVLTDKDRGGTFVYDSTATDDDDGTVFGKWVRQYDGAVNVKWFGVCSLDDLSTTQLKLASIFNNEFYKYYIPHDINYGYTRNTGDTLENLVTMPNLDFIVDDDSVDNGYTYPYHQGAQTRVYYNNINPTDGQHNSFDYKTSKHHIGSFYMLGGNGVSTDGTSKVRNATTFFGINGEAFWGIGMGGVSGSSTDTDTYLTPFKIVANKYRGVSGLTNIHNINNETGYFGWRTGVNPETKYEFKFEDKADGTSTSSDYIMQLRGKVSKLPTLRFTDGTNILSISATIAGFDFYDGAGNYGSFNRDVVKLKGGSLRFSTYLGIWGDDESNDRIRFTNNAGSTKVDMNFDIGEINIIENLKLSSLVILVPNLPTTDPLVAGQLWNNSGVVTVSAG